ARDIYCCATHALLSGPAVDRLMASPVKEVAVTNTIAIPPERRFDRLKVLSIAGLLAKAIGYTHSDQSVSSCLDKWAAASPQSPGGVVGVLVWQLATLHPLEVQNGPASKPPGRFPEHHR